MTANEVVMFLVGIALSCGVFALLFIVYPRVNPRSATVVRAAIESALQPFIFQGIMAAYRVSEKGVDQGYARLLGTGKKQLADDVYRLLPERIGDFDITFVKSHVAQERFRELVQNVFDQFDRFYLINHEHFDMQFQRWVAQAKAAAATSAATTTPSTDTPST